MNQTRIFLKDRKLVFNGSFHLLRKDVQDYIHSTTLCQSHLAISRAVAKKLNCIVYVSTAICSPIANIAVYEKIPYVEDVYVEVERYSVGWVIEEVYAYCKVVGNANYVGNIDTQLSHMLSSDEIGYYTDEHGTMDYDGSLLAFRKTLAIRMLAGQSKNKIKMYLRSLKDSTSLLHIYQQYKNISVQSVEFPFYGTCEQHDEYGHCC